MALDTLTDLETSVQEWLIRETDSKFSARARDFIALCEANINGRLKVIELERRARGNAVNEYETVPSDFNRARTVSIIQESGKHLNLDFRSPDQMSIYSETVGTTRDMPRQYSIIGRELWFLPIPGTRDDGQPFEYELIYYAQVPPLNDGAPTNSILQRYPDIYLYGSLMEASAYVQDQTSTQRFSARFEGAVMTANDQGDKARWANTPAIGMPQ